ncbi:MAG: alpha/beta hydrolase [Alphaproteobacteria bacterium]|nr:alpha/beta hydrolase [Alphaproteobacteria bacterium]
MEFLDLPDIKIAYRREGAGPPLVFLHGWPEWSGIWRRNLPVLRDRFEVVAPDLRNFGDSVGEQAADIDHYVADLEALVDYLGYDRFGLVSHDVGAFLAQDYARRHPDRLAGLFFFDCPHFGLGRRWVEGGQVREIWYQSFHQLPLAEELVGASRASCRAYFRHFLAHWARDPSAFDDVLEEWVDNFLKPGRLAGGFRWYSVAAERRLKAMDGGSQEQRAKIQIPAYSLWGAHDPILRADWQPTLAEVFADIELDIAPKAGHFVAWEQPKLANERIARFFEQRFA